MHCTRLLVIGLLTFTCQQLGTAEDNVGRHEALRVEDVIAYAVGLEVQASHLKGKADLCVGFGNGLKVDDKTITSELRHSGLKFHPNEWCNEAGRGLTIAVVAPIREKSRGHYEIVIEVGDMAIKPGEHFATLLKRGTYLIATDEGAMPNLISYQETCCSKTD